VLLGGRCFAQAAARPAMQRRLMVLRAALLRVPGAMMGSPECRTYIGESQSRLMMIVSIICPCPRTWFWAMLCHSFTCSRCAQGFFLAVSVACMLALWALPLRVHTEVLPRSLSEVTESLLRFQHTDCALRF
jgi:hypothetical protein